MCTVLVLFNHVLIINATGQYTISSVVMTTGQYMVRSVVMALLLYTKKTQYHVTVGLIDPVKVLINLLWFYVVMIALPGAVVLLTPAG